MKIIKKDLIAIIAMLIPIIYLAIIYSSLPQTVPTHFNLSGKINGWGNKRMLWLEPFLMPVMIYVIMSAAEKIDPKRKIKNTASFHRLKIILTVLLSLLCCNIIHSSQTGKLAFSPFMLIGILFAVIGNYLYSIKPNYFIGIRTPWTLENEEVWRKTHRMAAPIWVVTGILVCISTFILPSNIAYATSLIYMLIAALIPVIYSYIIWKKLK